MDGLNDIDEYFKQMFLTYTFESVMQDDDVVRHRKTSSSCRGESRSDKFLEHFYFSIIKF